MLNVSLIHLSLSRIATSPFLSYSYSFTLSNVFLQRSVFSKSFSTAFYSSIPKSLQIRQCKFQQFLNPSVYIDNLEQYSNATIESKRISLLIGPIEISDCIFRLCIINDDIKGGAIFSLASMSLTQCLFEFNSAPIAGSLYQSGNLSLKSVTFESGYSFNAAGFMLEAPNANLEITLSTFANLNSNNNSCFLHDAEGNTTIKWGNFSTCAADESNAGIKIKNSNVKIIQSIFFELNADFDSTLEFDHIKNCRVQNTLFWFIRSHITNFDRSTIMSVSNTPAMCTLDHCGFMQCSSGSSTLFKGYNSGRILISNSCFSNDRFFVGNEHEIQFDNSTKFNEQCNEYLIIDAPNDFGYKTKDPIEQLSTLRHDMWNGTAIGLLSVLSMLIGIVISLFLSGNIIRFNKKEII